MSPLLKLLLLFKPGKLEKESQDRFEIPVTYFLGRNVRDCNALFDQEGEALFHVGQGLVGALWLPVDFWNFGSGNGLDDVGQNDSVADLGPEVSDLGLFGQFVEIVVGPVGVNLDNGPLLLRLLACRRLGNLSSLAHHFQLSSATLMEKL